MKPWSSSELRVLREHAMTGVDGSHEALLAAGFSRSREAVKSKRRVMGLALLVPVEVCPVPAPLASFPRYPVRVTAALAALAESNPSPEVYEARKAEILGGAK